MVHAAGAAAAHRRRQLREEEEELTAYSPEDLEEGWEFKIVRSTMGRFGNPETMSRVVEEEAQAGWELLEKFDENRLRFKRPREARERDAMLPDGVDAYRTVYGWSEAATAIVIVAAMLVALGLAVAASQIVPALMR